MEDIYDNLQNKKYESKVPYPSKKDYTMLNAYKKGTSVMGISHGEIESYKKDGYIIESDFDRDAYMKAADKYHEEERRLYELFKNDLFAYFEVSDNPKKEKAFSIAWDKGHSSGYSEVVNEFSDLVDLIK